MRALFGILVVASISACEANEDVSAPPPDPQPNLWIQLNISGDRDAAPPNFSTTYDGIKWRDIAAGENRVVAVPGIHTVALASPNSKSASWCSPTEKNEFSGLIRSDVPTMVTFALDCPTLTAEGSVSLTVNASGSFAPSRIALTLVRKNGPPVSRPFALTNREPISVTLPVGLYSVVLASGVCDFLAHAAFGTPSLIVRQGVTTTFTAALPCNTNIP